MGLQAALGDTHLDEWTFEVGGEPVESHQEFQKRLGAATTIRE